MSKKQSERLEIRLAPELKQLLDEQADRELTSRSEIVRRALMQYMRRQDALQSDKTKEQK